MARRRRPAVDPVLAAMPMKLRTWSPPKHRRDADPVQELQRLEGSFGVFLRGQHRWLEERGLSGHDLPPEWSARRQHELQALMGWAAEVEQERTGGRG